MYRYNENKYKDICDRLRGKVAANLIGILPLTVLTECFGE